MRTLNLERTIGSLLDVVEELIQLSREAYQQGRGTESTRLSACLDVLIEQVEGLFPEERAGNPAESSGVDRDER